MSLGAVGLFTHNIGFDNVTLRPGPFDLFGGNSGIQGVHCVNVHGRIISRGLHYVPGPDECVDCVCGDEGGPQLCQSMSCQPPQHQGCEAKRNGNETSCCDFICLEGDPGKNGLGNRGNGPPYGNFVPVDMGVVIPKIIITALLSMLSLSLLFFLVHRLRQREIRGRLNSLEARRARQMCDECDDTRSLDFSVYDFERSPIPNAHLFPPQYMTWSKPPSYYFPSRCEAPPPYEEAIASSSNIIPLLCMYTSEGPVLQTLAETVADDLGEQNHSESNEQKQNAVASAIVPGVALVACPDDSKGHVDDEQIPGPSCRINSTQILESRQDSLTHKKHSNSASPPAYSAVVTARHATASCVAFRRSLTLPRRPNFLATEFGDSEESEFQRNQQRHSLQLHVADWNSLSSSSLSLTPSSPILIRDPSSSSSSSGFSRST